jgi:fructokinase
VDALVLPFGSKLSADSYLINPGGSGANVAIGMKRLGVEVTLLSAISTDEFGLFLEKKLSQELTSLDILRFDSPSPLSVVLNVGAERTIVTAHSIPEEDLRKPLPKVGHIHLGSLSGSNNEAFYQKLIIHIIQTDQSFSLNPSMFDVEQRERAFLSVVRATSILVLNQEEGARLARLAPKTEPKEIIVSLRKLTDGIICLTCSEHGAYVNYYQDKKIWFSRALTPASERINATGAGDAFTAGFVSSYLLSERQLQEEDRIIDALKWGIINSGSVVGSLGAQTGLLKRRELQKDLATVQVRAV